jgi:heat shock protein HtpX
VKQTKITGHSLANKLHTLLLFVGMLVLLAALGLTMGGIRGLLWAVILAIPTLLIGRHISPRLIARLYRARPLSPANAPGLYELLANLSQRAGLSAIPQLYYVPSHAMNAFSLGRREAAMIGVTDGMLRKLNTRELNGVLAHEVAHVQGNDARVVAFADLISRATALFSRLGQLLLLLNLPLLLLGMTTVPWFGIVLLLLAPTLSGLLQLAISRTREFEADLGAVQLVGDPVGLASALRKIEQQTNALRGMLVPGYHERGSSLLRTHPQTEQRVERLLALAENEPRQTRQAPVHTW